MIDLVALARLVADHAEDLPHGRAHPVAPFRIGDVEHDTDAKPVLMGVLNLSHDSRYRESIAYRTDTALRRGRVLLAQGAHVVDVGAESSNVAAARVDAATQAAALEPVVRGLVGAGVPVSVEGYDADVVRAGLAAGAQVVNLTGSGADAACFDLAAEHDAAVVLCHTAGEHARDTDGVGFSGGATGPGNDPVPALLEAFARRLDDARRRGVTSLAVDPGLGFGFSLEDLQARASHQAAMLLHTFRLRRLGVPVCHSLPCAGYLFEEQVRLAEGFFAVLAALGGTGIHRTHEVPHVATVLGAMRMLGTGLGAGAR